MRLHQDAAIHHERGLRPGGPSRGSLLAAAHSKPSRGSLLAGAAVPTRDSFMVRTLSRGKSVLRARTRKTPSPAQPPGCTQV